MFTTSLETTQHSILHEGGMGLLWHIQQTLCKSKISSKC